MKKALLALLLFFPALSFPAEYTNYFCPITITGTAASWGGNLPATPAVTVADIGQGGGGGGSSLIFDHNTFIATAGTADAMVFVSSENALSASDGTDVGVNVGSLPSS